MKGIKKNGELTRLAKRWLDNHHEAIELYCRMKGGFATDAGFIQEDGTVRHRMLFNSDQLTLTNIKTGRLTISFGLASALKPNEMFIRVAQPND